jgi:Icc-related predicted phosphoesterase
MDQPGEPREIKTRILIISDTHGQDLPTLSSGPTADVAIHCGDLTDESKLNEFETSIRLLKRINAPLKLVIGGNHDFTLYTPAFERLIAEARRFSTEVITKEEVEREYGATGQAAALFKEAAASGIILLDEGTHAFDLADGARLTVFSSPFTPSITASMGFQYVVSTGVSSKTPFGTVYSDGHPWPIPKGTDIVMTHGPPLGVFDLNHSKKRIGSDALFAAVAEARPRLHCFGHIHESWGARVVTWRSVKSHGDFLPSHLTHIDNGEARIIESLACRSVSRFAAKVDPTKSSSKNTSSADQLSREDLLANEIARIQAHKKAGAVMTSVSKEDETPLEVGEQTLFVNASIKGTFQLPWVIDIDLPRAQKE